jgi:hypothetical protein
MPGLDFPFYKLVLYKIESMWLNIDMEHNEVTDTPTHCPVCGRDLVVTRLECSSCGTEVTGSFTLGRLATLPEPHASLIEMFLRSRGNVKEMERELGLSYPTVRARLDEALTAAGYPKRGDADASLDDENFAQAIEARVEAALSRANLEERIRSQVERNLAGIGSRIDASLGGNETKAAIERQRRDILDALERGDITPADAAAALRQLKTRRS